MKSLKNWLDDFFLQNIETNTLNSYLLDTPFRAGFIPKVFRTDVFQKLQEEALAMNKSEFDLHPYQYMYHPFPNKEFFLFINSSSFMSVLKLLAGKPVYKYHQFPYPQLHHFSPSSQGLNIHTDHGTGRQFATLMYMNLEWQKGMGGELNLYRKINDQFQLTDTIDPLPNSMFFFEVTERSYHSIAPMLGVWHRDTIITDWQFDAQT